MKTSKKIAIDTSLVKEPNASLMKEPNMSLVKETDPPLIHVGHRKVELKSKLGVTLLQQHARAILNSRILFPADN
ncbi:hypothetical protein PanWU01x14_334370 [Parasponia andersonii]|uniref:Uncharacterized protein n=1 Tax=Parasponia andersonii TaxID=3476 RepID=A0A2P5AGM3_PARAD|nr:hypothetical protein PanWU01x14_334370 [Parasponia andersonii]